ncbi:MAG: deoxynucleoside kinase [Chitinophagales bacterium]
MNRFVAIEGCIGAGKTTVTKMLAESINAPIMLENFEDNPYLQNFYADPDKHAFPLELFFMAERYQQQKSLLEKINLFDEQVFMDYAFVKSFIFANMTLKNEDEKQLFKMLFSIINQNIRPPDLIIYLHKSTDLLLQNIAKRGRSYEQEIPAEYLDNLNHAYMDYFKTQTKSKVVIVDSEQLDFIENKVDFEQIKQICGQSFEKSLNYV